MVPGSTGQRSHASCTGSRACRASTGPSKPVPVSALWLHTITGRGKGGVSARSSGLRAPRPPAEQPTTIASSLAIGKRQHGAAIDAQAGVYRGELGGTGGELQALAQPEAEEASAHEAVAEKRQHPVLQRVGEVDQHVAAEHQLRLAEHLVGDQVVVGEADVASQAWVELDEHVARAVVVGQRMATAGLEVVARRGLRCADRVDALLRAPMGGRVVIGRVDLAALVEPFLLQQDGERVHLLSARAARETPAGRGTYPRLAPTTPRAPRTRIPVRAAAGLSAR